MQHAAVDLSLPLDNTPGACRMARRAVSEALGNGPSSGFLADALLMTSELVTNAVLHTGSECLMRMHFEPDTSRLRVEILDCSTTPPVVTDRAAGLGGFGLRIVSELADRRGTTQYADGKSVWFELVDAPGRTITRTGAWPTDG